MVSLELLRQLGLDAANNLPGGWQVGALAGLRGLMPGTLPVGQSPQYAGPQGNPMSPWDSVGGQDFLGKSMADRQAFYDRNSLSRQAPAFMGKETASIADIPVGNQITPSRRWSGMDGQPGGGLEADPLGATRMSQPIVGGPIGPDANDIAQQARAADYQSQLDALQALDRGARPIIEATMTPGTGLTDGTTVPNRSRQILDQLEAMPNVPDSTRQQMAFAGLNTGGYDRMMDGPRPLYSDQQRADMATQRKAAQGNRAADLATRQKAVQDRARRKGEARDMRMGDGGTLGMDKYMQMLQAMNGGGSGGPAAMGPGSRDPAMLTMMFGPQVAELYRLQAKDRNDAAVSQAQLGIQQQQQNYMQQKLAEEQKQGAISSLPPTMRKPGYIDQVTSPGGAVPDERIALFVQDAMQQGMKYRDQIAAHLASQGYTDHAQNDRVISTVFGGKEAFPAGGMFGWDPNGLIPSLFGGTFSGPERPVSARGVSPMSMGQ